MSHDYQRFIIITGGPGSGKSTLIDALENKGFARTVEAGRAIIQHQMKIDGQALPWADRALFAELMLSWEMRSYDLAHQSEGPVFFDRGIADVIGYLTLCGLPVGKHVKRAAAMIRYNRTVFLAPPWVEIFAKDEERKQSFEEALKTFEVMENTYKQLGYEIALLPKSSVQERVHFIQKSVPSVFV